MAAEWGSAVHRWKESGEWPTGRIGTTLRKKVKESGVERDTYWATGLHEVPLAYNVVTSRVQALVLPFPAKSKDEWKAQFGDEWITGTADYVGLLLDAPWVDDLKTGRRVDYIDHRYQQAFYALVWCLFNQGGLEEVRSTITHWPKYPLSDKPRRFGTVLTVDYLGEFAGRLKQLREDVIKLRELEEAGRRESVVVRLTDGPQCGYCPSRLACVKGQKYEL